MPRRRRRCSPRFVISASGKIGARKALDEIGGTHAARRLIYPNAFGYQEFESDRALSAIVAQADMSSVITRSPPKSNPQQALAFQIAQLAYLLAI